MSASKTVTSNESGSSRELYELLRDAWLTPLGRDRNEPSLRSRVHNFFERAQRNFDRGEYSSIIQDGLGQFVRASFLNRFPGFFDLCAVEYRSLALRIVGETPFPESLLFLFGTETVSPKELEIIDRVMRAAYGRELTYLTLIPEGIGWLQVIYHRSSSLPDVVPVPYTLDLPIEGELQWLRKAYGKNWYDAYLKEESQREIKEEIRRRLKEKVAHGLKTGAPLTEEGEALADRDRLVDMVASTPFMTLTRMSHARGDIRSILYLPAHLHGERLGGAVLMGPRRMESQDLLGALHITLQLLLSHLRLVEFPEEVRLAERDILLRQFVRRFRHNMMHPLGNLMDATRRFQESFQQLLVTFERGIDAWQPDLMPNPFVTFLNYAADEYRAEEKLPAKEGESAEDLDAGTFPIVVKGTDRIEHFDRSILAEVLGNLMSNTARYAVGRGLERVEIDARESGPLITYREIGGPGLPPAIATDPWRLHARHPGEEESSGQGLFLAKKLMEIHGGHIDYEQDTTGGCKFRVYLRKEGKN